MRRFDAIESRSDCRDSPGFVVARQRHEEISWSRVDAPAPQASGWVSA